MKFFSENKGAWKIVHITSVLYCTWHISLTETLPCTNLCTDQCGLCAAHRQVANTRSGLWARSLPYCYKRPTEIVLRMRCPRYSAAAYIGQPLLLWRHTFQSGLTKPAVSPSTQTSMTVLSHKPKAQAKTPVWPLCCLVKRDRSSTGREDSEFKPRSAQNLLLWI